MGNYLPDQHISSLSLRAYLTTIFHLLTRPTPLPPDLLEVVFWKFPFSGKAAPPSDFSHVFYSFGVFITHIRPYYTTFVYRLLIHRYRLQWVIAWYTIQECLIAVYN